MPSQILREELKSYAKEYENAVREQELAIFVNYIVRIVKQLARRGGTNYSHPVLDKSQIFVHSTNGGLLDKSDPGPVPLFYVETVLKKLQEIFTDSDITYTEAKIGAGGFPHKGVIGISWI